MSHPSLGAPPPDVQAGFPDAAARLRANTATIAARAMEAAVERDPTFTARYDELGLRQLLRDAEVYLERIASSVATNRTIYPAEWADWVAPLYRRRRVPMDDLISIGEGLRGSVRAFLGPDEMAVVNVAIDEAVRIFRWNRRIAGDARKRNRILQFFYKGA